MYQACGSSKNSKLNHADPQGTQSRGGGGDAAEWGGGGRRLRGVMECAGVEEWR